MKRKIVVNKTHVCSDEYGVSTLSVTGGRRMAARATPCEACPWRKDVPAGVFPAEAFRQSAKTAYDMAESSFSCHVAGVSNQMTCAGYLVRHGEHSLQVRLAQMLGRLDLDAISDGGFPLYKSYREMAIANGVSPDDETLRAVRGYDE